MQDVIRIDFMPVTALKVSVPFNVPNITSATVTMSDDAVLSDTELYTDSLLSLNLNGDALADAEMGEGLAHKVTDKMEMAGIVRTHTLQIPIDIGFQEVRQQQNALHQTDFHIVLTTYDGTRYLAYALPSTSQFTIEDQMGQQALMTVKATVQSMSGFIKITAASS